MFEELDEEAFAAAFPAGAPVLGGRPLIAHDAKPLLAAWMDAGVPPPTVDDTAVAAYLLNPARATYRLDEVCMEVFGECPAALTSVPAVLRKMPKLPELPPPVPPPVPVRVRSPVAVVTRAALRTRTP